MRIGSLLSFLVALVLVGCDSTPAITPPDVAPVLSLAVGTEWTLAQAYTVNYDADGSVRDTVVRAGVPDLTLTIPRDTVVAGETWARIESTRDHGVFTRSGGWFANREDGLYRLHRTPEGTESAERVYAIGVPEGTPFLTTDLVTAVLSDDDATADLPSGPVSVRQYDRTWKRLEFNTSIRGPIDPMPVTQDQFSAEQGPVSLEIAYVRTSGGTTDDFTFSPTMLIRYELAAGASAAPARVAPEAEGTYPVR